MGEPRKGPRLIIETMILYTIFGDEEFYTKVPVYFFMKDLGLSCYMRARDAAMNKPGSCGGCSIRGLLKPAVDVFINHTVQLAEKNREALEPLLVYLTGRKGYRPTPVVVYHRDRYGRAQKLEL